MLNLFKAAIKKESNGKNDSTAGDLDAFFGRGAGKDRSKSDLTASVSKAAKTEDNRVLPSSRTDLGAEELGLVIRDLDKERGNKADKQPGSIENDSANGRVETAGQEIAAVTGGISARETEVKASIKEKSSPSRSISEGTSVDQPCSTDRNSEEKEREKDECENANEATDSSQAKLQKVVKKENVNEEATGSLPNMANARERIDEAMNLTQQAAETVHGEIEDDDSVPRSTDSDVVKVASQDNGGLEDPAWEPRNLDEEMAPRDSNEGIESDDDQENPGIDGSQSAAGNEAHSRGDEASEVDDSRSQEEYEDDYEGSYDAGTPRRVSEVPDTRSDMEDAQFDDLDEAMTPNLDDREETGPYSDFDDGEGGDADDFEPSIDEMGSEQNYDTDLDDECSNFDQEYDEGAEFEETNERIDYDFDSELADDIEQDEEALDGIDQGSQFEDDVSDNDVEEGSQRPDEHSDVDSDSAGVDFDPNAVEQNVPMSDDLSEGDVDLNKDDDAELPEDLDVDEDMEEDQNVEEDEYLEEDDDLEAADQQSRLATESHLGSQVDLDDLPPENPLSVPIGEWTEAHMEAFRIHFRSKANVFDFLTRKGVANRERVSGVVTEALKLCLKDSTALHGKTHATVFLEAGGTPLGPFLAFLALTVQSTMNSTKEEKNGKEAKMAKEEKNVNGQEKTGEDEEPQPPEAADEPDPWDDFDLEDNLEAPPSHLEAPKPGPVAPALNQGDTPGKRPEVATNVMVVMFLQAVLETSRAAISGPARAYLEWTFISQELEINSRPANCKDQNDGSLHEKRSKRTAAFNLTWEDVNPLEYVSIGAQQMYSKQHYIHSGDAKAPVAAQMISMICERLRASETTLSEYDRTTFVITSTSTAISFAYAVFTPEYIKHFELEEGCPSTQSPELDDLVIESEPELKIFESSPYDLSKWDEALEAAELALAMVEFLQREGPLLALSSAGNLSNRENSLRREKTSASPPTGSPGSRFPIKVSPKQPENPAPSEPDAEAEGDADEMSEQGEEGDRDSAQQSLEEGSEEDKSDNEEGLNENDALEEGTEDDPVREGKATGKLGNNEEALEDKGALETEHVEDDTDEEEGLAERQVDDEDVENADEEELDGDDEFGEEEGATDIDEENSEHGLGSERNDVFEEDSVYEDVDTDADLDYQSEAAVTPYSEEGEEAWSSNDRASIYDEDRNSPEGTPITEDHLERETVDDDYMSGDVDGHSFHDSVSENGTQAYTDDDYMSDEDNSENFYDGNSDDDARAEVYDDDLSEAEVGDDYLSEEDGTNFEDNLLVNATQVEVDNDYLSENNGEDFGDDLSDATMQAEMADDYVSEADGENFHDDYSENAAQSEVGDDYVAEDREGEILDELSDSAMRARINDDGVYEADDGDFQDEYSDSATQAELDEDYLSEEPGEGLGDDRDVDHDYLSEEQGEHLQPEFSEDDYLSEEQGENLGDNFSDDATQAGMEEDQVALNKDFVDEESYTDYESNPDAGFKSEYEMEGDDQDDNANVEISKEHMPHEGEEGTDHNMSPTREEASGLNGSSDEVQPEEPIDDAIDETKNPAKIIQASHNKHEAASETDHDSRTPFKQPAPENIDENLDSKDIYGGHPSQADDEIYLPDARFEQADMEKATRPAEREVEIQDSTTLQSPRETPPQPPPKDDSPATHVEHIQASVSDQGPKQDQYQAVLPNQGFEFQFGTPGEAEEDQQKDPDPDPDQDQDQDQDQSILPDTVYNENASTSQKQHQSSSPPSPQPPPQQLPPQQDPDAGKQVAREDQAFEPGVPVEGYIYDEATGEYYPADDDARPQSEQYDGNAYNGEGYIDSGDHLRQSYDGQAYDGHAYDGKDYGGNAYDDDYNGQGYAASEDGAYDSAEEEEEERLWQEQQQQQQHLQQGGQLLNGVREQGHQAQQAQQQQRQQVMANAF